MPLFEVAVIEAETKEKPEKLVLAPQTVLAKDAQAAGMKVVMKNPAALQDADADRMQVLVRPFA